MSSHSTHTTSEKSTKSSISVDGFQERLKKLESSGQEKKEMPANLGGGVLIDQHYALSSWDLNLLLFSSNSALWSTFLELQGATQVVEGAWEESEGSLKRVMTFTKPGKKFIKVVKAIVDHSYLKADGESFAVFESMNTPEVPCGGSFRLEVLYCITPGHESSSLSGEKTSHLVISWRVKFVQSTMIKGMIESGAKQGFKEQFEIFSKLLAETIRPPLQDLEKTALAKQVGPNTNTGNRGDKVCSRSCSCRVVSCSCGQKHLDSSTTPGLISSVGRT